MKTISVKTPWKDYMGDVPMHLQYFEGSMYDAVAETAKKYPNNVAFDFMGKSTTYKKLMQEIELCAKALRTIGIRENDRVTIAMPNCPQAIYLFYAVNLVGGIANMIHPLSAEKEIEFYLNESESVTAITLDQFYHKFERVRQNTKVVNIVIASIKDALSPTIRAGYMLTEGRKIEKIPDDAPVIRWADFMRMSKHCFYNYKVERRSDDPAVILYSGGTTGTTKGIVLTNKNFNALGQQVVAANPMFRPGDKMLAAISLSRHSNCFIANIVKCRPPGNRDPLPEECHACRSYLDAQIAILKPRLILCMGRVATQNLLQTTLGIGQLRGKFTEYNGIPCMATYHPSALLRNQELKRPAWEDLKVFRERLQQICPGYEGH